MQITVTIADELAAEIQSRGMTPQSYLESLIAKQLCTQQSSSLPHEVSTEQFEAALDELTRYSDKIPSLPDSALSRESFYLKS
jgi:hypothetical protein